MDSESVRTSSILAVGVIVYSRPAPAVIEGAEVLSTPFLMIIEVPSTGTKLAPIV